MSKLVRRKTAPRFKKSIRYLTGMAFLDKGDLVVAAQVLAQEPPGSECYEFALGNAALAYLRLDDYPNAIAYARRALSAIRDRGRSLDPPSHIQFARTWATALSHVHPEASLEHFNAAAHGADELIKDYPDFAEDTAMEQAHVFGDWGGALIRLGNWEAAVDCLERARNEYRALDGYEWNGLAEALTNLNLALRNWAKVTGEDVSTRADVALQEALDIARGRADQDQEDRVLIAAVQSGSNIVPPEDRFPAVANAARRAREAQRFATAHLREAIGAELALNEGDSDLGLEFAQRALDLEPQVEADRNTAGMRVTHADLLEAAGRPADERLPSLFEAARQYYELARAAVSPGDVVLVAERMHDPLRRLSATLLEAGRPDDAVAAFEFGRALIYARVVGHDHLSRRLASNPFSTGSVSATELQDLQSVLGTEEVAVSIVVLPPRIVAFVVSSHRVDTVAVDLTEAQARTLFEDVRDLPHRLEEAIGKRAVPPLVLELGGLIAEAVGTRSVVLTSPYAWLQRVPWRAVLRDAGVPWSRLPLTTSFALLPTPWGLGADADSGGASLGFDDGSSHGPDLVHEARAVADAAGLAFTPQATSSDLRSALASEGTVFVSCHGRESDGSVHLSLSDGHINLRDAIPPRSQAALAILSACESGVFSMAFGDRPVGALPDLLASGVRSCVAARFRSNATFAAELMPAFASHIAGGSTIQRALSDALESAEREGFDLWRDLSCYDVVAHP
ncbi:MAG: hypothetical protein SangKO_099890 [Sandaracinaceae bacterium]